MPAINWATIGAVIVAIYYVTRMGHSLFQVSQTLHDIYRGFPQLNDEISKIRELLEKGQKWMEHEEQRINRLEHRVTTIEKNHADNSRHQ